MAMPKEGSSAFHLAEGSEIGDKEWWPAVMLCTEKENMLSAADGTFTVVNRIGH